MPPPNDTPEQAIAGLRLLMRFMKPRFLMVALSICLAVSGCKDKDHAANTPSQSPDLEARRQHLKNLDSKMSEEALDRKQRSISILKADNVPYTDNLPCIETEADSKRRTTVEVATRAMALCIVAVKGEGLEQETVNKLVRDYDLASAFTLKEKAFIDNPRPTDHDRAEFAWRYETYWVMLWVLGFTDTLQRPDAICDVKRAVSILRENGREGFLKKAKLRSQSEMLDAADLIYRYHWATKEARVKGKKPPAKLGRPVSPWSAIML